MNKCILILALSTVSPALWAADDQGDFSIRGAGLVDCKAYVKERAEKSPAYLMMGGWIDGYLTATNQYRQQTYDIAPYQTTELLTRIIDNHCQQNPDDRLFSVVNTIVAKLLPNRIIEGQKRVQISVGDRTTTLYPDTIRKLQSRLIEAGLMKGSTTGEYDPATKAAVQAYQESIDFTPTGFPDQATLWRLLTD